MNLHYSRETRFWLTLNSLVGHYIGLHSLVGHNRGSDINVGELHEPPRGNTMGLKRG